MLEHKPSAGYWRRAFRESVTRGEAIELGRVACLRIEELEDRVVSLGGDITGGICLRSQAEGWGRADEASPTATENAEVHGLSSA